MDGRPDVRERLGRLSMIPVALVLVVLLAAGSPAQQVLPGPRKELTLERIYGQPSLLGSLAPGTAWSPDGKLLSFFERTSEGPRLLAMEASTGARRVLVSADKLEEIFAGAKRGQSQATGLGRHPAQWYLWSPRGDVLLFSAGNNLFVFDLKTQSSRELVTGQETVSDVKFSPDGRVVSFLRGHDLWVVEAAGGKPRQITTGGSEEIRNGELDWVYPEELEISTAYWWSPDSTQIAYLQMDERQVTHYPVVDSLSYTGEMQIVHYPKAGGANPVVRVGVAGVAPGKTSSGTRWMTTGKDADVYIPRVAWAPDSKHVTIQRLNRAQNQLDLLVADAGTGHSETVLQEKDPYWVNVAGDPIYLEGGKHFLWTSERDGFRHIYLYLHSAGGTLVRQLTRGEWVVTEVAGVDETAGLVYFVATEKSPLERHLYSVRLPGGPIRRITREPGTHEIVMAPGAGHFLDTFSNVTSPPRQDIYSSAGDRVAVLNEAPVTPLAEYGVVRPEFGTLRGEGGIELRTEIIRPPDFDPAKKYPVIVFTYGGPHAQIVTDAWDGARSLWHQMLAQKGYIIFKLDNRGSSGRGHAFEAPVFHHLGDKELADQIAGVNYLKSLPYVDGARIGIWGWSYGGYMTCIAMLNAPDVFRAAFAGSPVTDWRQYDTIYTERYMGRPQDNPEGYKNSSPVTHAANLRGKLLIAFATGDDNVHFSNSLELQERFIQAGRHAEFMPYANRGHGITDVPARIHLFSRVTQFFLDNL